MFSPDELVLYPSYQTSWFFIALLLYHHCYVQAAGHPVCTGGLAVSNLSQVLEFYHFIAGILAYQLYNCDLVIFMAPANIAIFY